MKRYGTSINRDAIACIRGWKALKFIDKVEAPALEKDDPQLVQSDTLEFWLLQVDNCYVVVTNYYILMCRRLRFWTLLETSGQTFLGLPRCFRCPCHLRASVISPQRTSSFVSFSRLIMTTIDFFGLEK